MPKIDVVYVFIATDKGSDDEGVVAAFRGGAWIPLVGADKERVKSLKPVAEQIAGLQGRRLHSQSSRLDRT